MALHRLTRLKKAHPKRGFRLKDDIEYRGSSGQACYCGTHIQVRLFKRGCRGKEKYVDYEYFKIVQ